MNAMAARKDGYPVRDLLPEKTILVPEAVALLKGAPNEATGKIFLDWLFSKEGQQAVLEGRYFAAGSDIKFSNSPCGKKKASKWPNTPRRRWELIRSGI
jgi:ABC-type Fe3+ transport system substrate-binding protein